MFQVLPCFTSQSNSYHLNYCVTDRLYTWLDKHTPVKKSWIRGLCISVWVVSSFLTLVTRIASVVEVFFVGLKCLIYSPFKRDMSLAKKGVYEITKHMPKDVLRLLSTPITFLGGTFFAIVEPKWFIWQILSHNRVNLKHIRNKTIGTEDHKKDLDSICFNGKFLDYQEKFFDIHGRNSYNFL